MANKKQASSSNTSVRFSIKKSHIWTICRVLLGIIVLCVLLSISMDMINDQFATKQAELVEDSKKDFGWIAITIGYTLPLVLAAVVPVLACVGCKKDAQYKHLVKGLIILGAVVIIFGIVCPARIKDKVELRKTCEAMEQAVEDNEELEYPDHMPELKDVTTELERMVKWTAKAALGIAVVGVYHAARYKKLRDGDLDEEIPEDETADDLPDVDWVEGSREQKNS